MPIVLCLVCRCDGIVLAPLCCVPYSQSNRKLTAFFPLPPPCLKAFPKNPGGGKRRRTRCESTRRIKGDQVSPSAESTYALKGAKETRPRPFYARRIHGPLAREAKGQPSYRATLDSPPQRSFGPEPRYRCSLAGVASATQRTNLIRLPRPSRVRGHCAARFAPPSAFAFISALTILKSLRGRIRDVHTGLSTTCATSCKTSNRPPIFNGGDSAEGRGRVPGPLPAERHAVGGNQCIRVKPAMSGGTPPAPTANNRHIYISCH